MGVKLGTAVTTVVALLLGMVLTADAASIRVKCEKRANRSKISVDGFDLAVGAAFNARVRSPQDAADAAAVTSKASINANAAGEAEFDFDTNANDVAAGATSIGADFIKNNNVKGEILDAAGAVAASASATCRQK